MRSALICARILIFLQKVKYSSAAQRVTFEIKSHKDETRYERDKYYVAARNLRSGRLLMHMF